MMKAWWSTRTPREQTLMGVMGTLVLVLTLSLGVVGPLPTARDRAKLRYTVAHKDLTYIQWASERLGGGGALGQGQNASQNAGQNAARARSQRSVREIVGATHGAAGLVIDAVTPSGDGQAAVRLDSVAPGTLFSWLQQLQANHGVVVVRANVRRSARDDTVSANLTLARGR